MCLKLTYCADKIELRNPPKRQILPRGRRRVWIDGESLAEMLKAKGLAKDYDGEGRGRVIEDAIFLFEFNQYFIQAKAEAH